MKRICLLCLLSTSGVIAHPALVNHPHSISARSGRAAASEVSITEENGQRLVISNGMPDHAPGQFPNRGNPNALSPQDYTFRMTLTPLVAEQPTSAVRGWFGVALNGVPFEPGTAEFWQGDRSWNYEALSGVIDLGLDNHHAHVQPTGAYHYHGIPTGLLGDEKTMTLVGWAADGFPIYGPLGHEDPLDPDSPLIKVRSSYQLREGRREGGPGGRYDGTFTADYEYVEDSGDLDECHGRFGVTPEFPQGIYHYYVTEAFPHVGRQWKGTPDPSFMKRGGGPGSGGPGGPGRGQGGPEGMRGPGGKGAPGMRGKGPPPDGGKGFPPGGRPPPPPRRA